MFYYLFKIIITAVLIVLISELSKRSSLLGGVLASIPLISVLAMIWLYVDTQDSGKVVALSNSVFWLLLPSLTLFISLPIFVKKGWGFYPSMGAAVVLTLIAYYLMVKILAGFGLKL